MHLGLEVSEMQRDSEITFVCMCVTAPSFLLSGCLTWKPFPPRSEPVS